MNSMSTLMFYNKPVAIDRVTHRDLRMKFLAKGYSYAAKTNSVPLASVEFSTACHEYPIVFVTDEQGGGIPLALTGLRDSENLFVNAEGQWDAAYIPAFVRRYPFVLQGSQDSEQFSVLIDSEADGFGAEDGERLFTEDGADSEMLTNVVNLLDNFRTYTAQTNELVKLLIKLDLLIPRMVNVTNQKGETFTLDGFSVVDEERLNALSDADLLGLARNGALAAIYAHLMSLPNIQKVMARLERILPAA
jgi:hypothetical protein